MREDEYYESSMNKGQKFDFDIQESLATFHHKTFLEQIRNEMQFYELSVESLSKSLNISNFRLSALINGNANFELREVQLIKNRLHLK